MTKAYSRLVAAVFCLFLGGMLVWSLLLPDRARKVLTPVLMAASLVLCTAYLVDGSYNPFLYFRF